METIAFHLMPYRDAEDRAWPFPNDSWDPEKGSQYYNEYLDQLELAADLGFDGLGVNEHHFSTYGLQPSPMVTASNLAARTDDVKIAFFGNLPAIRGNPIRLAEELAMLDNITEGRIISGFPRGIPSEYFAYNVDIEQSRDRFEEAWNLITKTWTADEPFDWDGEFWEYEDVYAWPRPYQDPHPKLWMPAESDESLRWAAEHEVPMGLVFNDTETIGELFDKYRNFAQEDYGWTPTDEDFTISRAVYVAETDEQAREEAEEHLRNHFKHLTAGIHLGVTAKFMGDDMYDPEKHDQYVDELTPHGELAYNFDFDDFNDNIGEIIVGSPETVIEKLEDQYDTVDGFGTLSGNFQFGTLPDDLTRKNIRTYAEEVMPKVKNLGSN